MKKSTKIRELKLINFKRFKEIELNLNKPLTIIVGRNNTGKTSILESIDMFFSYNSYNYPFNFDPTYYIRTGFKKSKIIVNGETLELFVDDGAFLSELMSIKELLFNNLLKIGKNKMNDVLKREIETYLSDYFENLIENLMKENYGKHLFVKRGDKEELIIPLHFAIKLEKFIGRLLVKLKRRYEDLFNITPIELRKIVSTILKSSNLKFKDPIYELINFGINKKVNERYLIKHCDTLRESSQLEELFERHPKKMDLADKIIKKYNLIEGYKKITENYIETDLGYQKISYFGDGFKQFLYLAIVMEEKDLVLLDEPTSFMHPSYIVEFTKLLINQIKEKNKQIIIATHDLDLIDNILYFEKFKDMIQFIRLVINDENEIIAKHMSFLEAKEEYEEMKLDLRGL